MKLPSIKTLKTIAPERAQELRTILEITSRTALEAVLDKYPVTLAWYRSCYHPMTFTVAKMSVASEIMEQHGVEYIPAGRGRRSPAIEYVNTGDGYNTTLLYVSGKGYRVGDWASIVERGDYA
jgi:hypothetical protein